MKNNIVKAAWILSGLALLLLVLHTIGVPIIKIDNTSVFLLLVVFFCLLAPWITEIDFAGIKAKISQGEIELLKNNVEKSLQGQIKHEEMIPPEKLKSNYLTITDLASVDALFALSKMRVELEKVLLALCDAVEPHGKEDSSLGLTRLIQKLVNKEIISMQLAGAVREVDQLCNRAVHGEKIDTPQTKVITEQGIQILKYLYDKLSEFRGEPKNTHEITKEELNKYKEAKYKVATVVPYVEKPVKNIYFLNQEGFEQFLDDSAESAEFIVEVSRIEE